MHRNDFSNKKSHQNFEKSVHAVIQKIKLSKSLKLTIQFYKKLSRTEEKSFYFWLKKKNY